MKIILFFLLTLYTIAVFAQKEENPDKVNIDFTKFQSKIFILVPPDTIFIPGFSISDITVNDYRYDTTTLGFMQKGFSDTRRLLKLKNGTIPGIKAYLRSSLSISSPDSSVASFVLICNIKKLWLSDEVYANEDNDAHRNPPKITDLKESGIILRLEFVLISDKAYIPLYRFDTTITGENNILLHGNKYISNALTASLKQLSSISAAKIAISNRRFNQSEIDIYNTQRFNIPILSEKMQKGVYLNFQEFRNNKPSIKAYRIDADKKNDYLYKIDGSGKEILLRNLYGYSDGENIFLSSAGNFFRLYRSGNTFNIYGAKSLKKVRQYFTPEKILLLGLNPETFSKNNTRVNYELKLHPYQLDMETGIVY